MKPGFEKQIGAKPTIFKLEDNNEWMSQAVIHHQRMDETRENITRELDALLQHADKVSRLLEEERDELYLKREV